MQNLLKSLAVAVLLTGCGGDDPRYRDTRMLERPPVLPVTKSVDNAVVEPDESVIPKKRLKKGLGDEVTMTYTQPQSITIKQPFETAWYTVALALKQSDMKLTDQVRDKGTFFVSYNPASLFGLLKPLKEVIYTLTLEANGSETKITVQKANSNEQATGLEKDGFDAQADDDSEALLQDVFDTLHDDLVDE